MARYPATSPLLSLTSSNTTYRPERRRPAWRIRDPSMRPTPDNVENTRARRRNALSALSTNPGCWRRCGDLVTQRQKRARRAAGGRVGGPDEDRIERWSAPASSLEYAYCTKTAPAMAEVEAELPQDRLKVLVGRRARGRSRTDDLTLTRPIQAVFGTWAVAQKWLLSSTFADRECRALTTFSDSFAHESRTAVSQAERLGRFSRPMPRTYSTLWRPRM